MNSVEDVRRHANALLDRFGISHVPIPVEQIADSLGAVVRFSPLEDSLSGMIFIESTRTIIGVNSHHHPNRQRFTIAHEIAHLQLHRKRILHEVHVDKGFRVLMRDGSSASGTERMEIEANQFAAELLMPSSLLNIMLKKRGFDIDDVRPLEVLARKFRVSKQALEFRIRNLRLSE